ncbi:MAG: hypothetical protein HIU84_13145 [Acidobacteria bacterium]|nr:hypothetical protein [Acidobacteriota bacterium]
MTISTHIVFVGQWISARANGGICGVTGKDNNWSWPVAPGPGVRGCQRNAKACSFKATAPTNQQLAAFCINGANVQGGWESCDYYGVVGDDMGIIDGHLLSKDGGAVSSATISAYGHPGATATSDADGFYAMQVKRGTYQVVPSGGPQGKASPSYSPRGAAANVRATETTHLDFTLDASVEVKLAFDKTSVEANGYELVSGTVTTTEYGKPLPNAEVQLEVQPGQSSEQAVTAGPRASVCSASGRIWPGGGPSQPTGYPVTITTDATGKYKFTVDVGTTPGKWTLDAWAFNSDGKLSTDVTAASDTKSIEFTKAGSHSLESFVRTLDGAARGTSISAALGTSNASASTLVTLLSGGDPQTASGASFGGLAFSLATSLTGTVMIISPADKPPVFNAGGILEPNLTRNADDLVFDPSIWTGQGLLPYVLSKGLLSTIPTVGEYAHGSSVQGWKTVKGDRITLPSGYYQEFGWGYPMTKPGACY